MSRCPSCGEYEVETYDTTEPDPESPGETLTFSVCGNCDHGCGAFDVWPNWVRLP